MADSNPATILLYLHFVLIIEIIFINQYFYLSYNPDIRWKTSHIASPTQQLNFFLNSPNISNNSEKPSRLFFATG
jgi:hypothetical protein